VTVVSKSSVSDANVHTNTLPLSKPAFAHNLSSQYLHPCNHPAKPIINSLKGTKPGFYDLTFLGEVQHDLNCTINFVVKCSLCVLPDTAAQGCSKVHQNTSTRMSDCTVPAVREEQRRILGPGQVLGTTMVTYTVKNIQMKVADEKVGQSAE
jgi:hypothetical protein